MGVKIVWGITGAGDLIAEVFDVMDVVSRLSGFEITAVLSKASVTVLKWYKLLGRLDTIAKKVLIEKDANAPFIVGSLQTGEYDCFLVAPATANTVAKIVHGIADTIITNSVSQTNKTNVDIYILPVDQKKGTTTTYLPNGKKLKLNMRDVDIENTYKLRKMEGIFVIEKPEEIKNVLSKYL